MQTFMPMNLIRGILVTTEAKTDDNNTHVEERNTKSYDVVYTCPIISNLYID